MSIAMPSDIAQTYREVMVLEKLLGEHREKMELQVIEALDAGVPVSRITLGTPLTRAKVNGIRNRRKPARSGATGAERDGAG